MKAAIVCLLLVAIATVSGENFQNQSRIFGEVGPGDRLLDHQLKFEEGKEDVLLAAFYISPPFSKGTVITCIKALDRMLNGTNGDVRINSGGVGQTRVILYIMSSSGSGIDYDIEIWGH